MLTLGNPLPSGWHEVRGDSGRTATMWSLARARPKGRITVIVPLGEPYDYQQVARWAGFSPEELLVVETRQSLLEILIELCESRLVGQVIFENLGFLMGSGKLDPHVEKVLGDITGFFTLTSLAKDLDIALYASGQTISDFQGPRGTPKDRALGGRLFLELCAERQLILKRQAFLTKYGQRTGERYSLTNLLTGEQVLFDLRYAQGPIKVRP